MAHIDPLVDSLIELCRREGGHEAGNPRGVSTALRKKLSEHYPDWLGITKTSAEPTLPDEINKLLQLYFSLHPGQRAGAAYAAMQAMISFLPRHSTAAPVADDLVEKPSDAHP